MNEFSLEIIVIIIIIHMDHNMRHPLCCAAGGEVVFI
jgi:hypothetical protein